LHPSPMFIVLWCIWLGDISV